MHMRFTDEELLTLAEMMTLACWGTFWNHKPGSDEGVARYDDMLEKILQRVQHGGLGDHVEIDPERQRLRLRKEREESSFHAQCYDEMRNETFWEELVTRMTERELQQQYSEAKMKAWSEEQRKQITEPVTKRYWKEFSEKGIGNLHVVARNGEG